LVTTLAESRRCLCNLVSVKNNHSWTETP
jgi:hypothetical protein